MDHHEAIRAMATEKYLLNELSPDLREDFEEHLFGCHECSMDVRAGSVFLEHSKADLAAPAPSILVPARASGLFSWWRAAFAVPAMAILLLIIGYQNLVTYPALKGALAESRSPHLLTVTSPIRGTSRGPNNAIPVEVAQGKPFLLPLEIPAQTQDTAPESVFQSYLVELHGPADTVEWSRMVSADEAKKSLLIQAPGVSRPGQYRIVVLGLNAKSEKSEKTVLETYLNLQFIPRGNPQP